MDLQQNPFFVLGATPREDRRRILELAEEKSLLADSALCAQARSDLTNPRKRLPAEIAWLPGVDPIQVSEALSGLDNNPCNLLTMKQLPALARANLIAAGLVRLEEKLWGKEITRWILALARSYERIRPEKVMRLINEDRAVAGFPEITEVSLVEEALSEQRRHFKSVIKQALDSLPAAELVKAVTVIVETATENGGSQAPVLVDDLVDSYEVDAQSFFEKETKNIADLIAKVKQAADAKQPDAVITQWIAQLEQVVLNWDFVAQPIQLSAKSRGIRHQPSFQIASSIRALSLYFWNEHQNVECSQRLTNLSQEVFSEVAEVAEQLEEDADALEEIAKQEEIRGFMEPVSQLCKSAAESAEKNPSAADKEARRVLYNVPHLISQLDSHGSAELTALVKDQIALTVMHCAVVYGNRTEDWKTCMALLEESRRLAMSEEVENRIVQNLQTARENGRWGIEQYHTPGAPAGPTRNARNSQSSSGNGCVIIFMCIIAGLIFSGVLLNESSNNRSDSPPTRYTSSNAHSTSSSYASKPSFDQPPQTMPHNGWIQRYHSSEAIAPLRIVTRPSGHHYFVKIEYYHIGRTAITIFVRDGASVDLDVPLGSYALKYACGTTWYGTNYLFGPETSYYKAEDRFDFQIEGNHVTGYTIELFLQRDGNLRTTDIPAFEF